MGHLANKTYLKKQKIIKNPLKNIDRTLLVEYNSTIVFLLTPLEIPVVAILRHAQGNRAVYYF
jgi:hypothetical protein